MLKCLCILTSVLICFLDEYIKKQIKKKKAYLEGGPMV